MRSNYALCQAFIAEHHKKSDPDGNETRYGKRSSSTGQTLLVLRILNLEPGKPHLVGASFAPPKQVTENRHSKFAARGTRRRSKRVTAS